MTDLLANPYYAVLALILGFGFLIFIHELGHFLVAKWVGIRATQFAIGFGHALLAWRKGIGLRVGSTEPEYVKRAVEHLQQTHAQTYTGKDEVESRYDSVRVHEPAHDPRYTERQVHEAADALGLGETEYRLNWMPLGGYVKMLGQEDMDPTAMSDDPRAYNRKSIGARMAVISAGVVMNLVFGMLFLIVAFSDFAGVKFAAPYVGEALEGSPAAVTYAQGHEGDPAFRGLQPGDHITHVHGKPIQDLVAVRIAGALGDPGEPVPLTVKRQGLDEPLTYAITPVADDRTEGMLAMGIQPAVTLTLQDIRDRQYRQNWAATDLAEQGVALGMKLTAVNGEPVSLFAEVNERIDRSGGRPVTLTFRDPATNTDVQATVQPDADLPRDASGEGSLLGLQPAAVVGEVSPEMPAAQAGLKTGDVLVRVGEVLYPASVLDVIDAIQQANGPIALEVLRDGQRLALEPVTPRGGKLGLGVRTGLAADVIRTVDPDSPFAALNLPPGSRLLALDGEPVTGFNDAFARLQARAAQAAHDEVTSPLEVEFTFAVNVGEGTEETVAVSFGSDQVATLAEAGWRLPAALPFEPWEVRIAGDTLGQAAVIGLEKTGEFVQQTYITLLRLFQGSVKPKHLRGPVGIVDAGSTVAARGWPYFLFFLGIISINLAVINFLPLPIVDGGHMVFLLIEKLRGKPASPQVQSAAMIVGLVLIASIFLLVTYQDIMRIVTRVAG